MEYLEFLANLKDKIIGLYRKSYDVRQVKQYLDNIISTAEYRELDAFCRTPFLLALDGFQASLNLLHAQSTSRYFSPPSNNLYNHLPDKDRMRAYIEDEMRNIITRAVSRYQSSFAPTADPTSTPVAASARIVPGGASGGASGDSGLDEYSNTVAACKDKFLRAYQNGYDGVSFRAIVESTRRLFDEYGLQVVNHVDYLVRFRVFLTSLELMVDKFVQTERLRFNPALGAVDVEELKAYRQEAESKLVRKINTEASLRKYPLIEAIAPAPVSPGTSGGFERVMHPDFLAKFEPDHFHMREDVAAVSVAGEVRGGVERVSYLDFLWHLAKQIQAAYATYYRRADLEAYFERIFKPVAKIGFDQYTETRSQNFCAGLMNIVQRAVREEIATCEYDCHGEYTEEFIRQRQVAAEALLTNLCMEINSFQEYLTTAVHAEPTPDPTTASSSSPVAGGASGGTDVASDSAAVGRHFRDMVSRSSATPDSKRFTP